MLVGIRDFFTQIGPNPYRRQRRGRNALIPKSRTVIHMTDFDIVSDSVLLVLIERTYNTLYLLTELKQLKKGVTLLFVN